jgi:hypothetical protein
MTLAVLRLAAEKTPCSVVKGAKLAARAEAETIKIFKECFIPFRSRV